MSNKSKDKRTLAKNWPKNEVIKLIELYEARPDLWDPSRPKYVDRVNKESQLSGIAKELNVTSAEVKAKFHVLRSQFNRECNKDRTVKSGSGTDQSYISKWEFKSSLQFLKVSTIPGNSVSNLHSARTTADESSNDFGTGANATNSDSNSAEIIVLSSDSDNNRDKVVPPRKRNKRRATETTDEDILFEKAIKALDRKEDEYDTLGQYIANELRRMSTENMLRAKREIQLILLNNSSNHLSQVSHSYAQPNHFQNNTNYELTTTSTISNGFDVNSNSSSTYMNDQYGLSEYTNL